MKGPLNAISDFIGEKRKSTRDHSGIGPENPRKLRPGRLRLCRSPDVMVMWKCPHPLATPLGLARKPWQNEKLALRRSVLQVKLAVSLQAFS